MFSNDNMLQKRRRNEQFSPALSGNSVSKVAHNQENLKTKDSVNIVNRLSH